MSTPFQPSDPHAPTMKPGFPILILVSLVIALGVVMLVAILAPRFAEEEGVHWGVTLGAGALTFIIAFLYGLSRRSQEAEERS